MSTGLGGIPSKIAAGHSSLDFRLNSAGGWVRQMYGWVGLGDGAREGMDWAPSLGNDNTGRKTKIYSNHLVVRDVAGVSR